MNPRIVAIYAGKGGVAKTTTAVNLSWQLGAGAHKTLLIDANADQQSARVVYDAIGGDVPYELAVEDKPELLRHVKQLQYDYIVIDCPPSPREARAAIDGADLVIVPYVPKFLETRAITDTIRLHLTGRPYRVLPVSVSHPMRRRAHEARAMLAAFQIPTFATDVRHYFVYERSQALGVPLFADDAAKLGDHAADAADDYRAVYTEMLSVLDGTVR
jgi:chromosome partitioning protein